MTINTYFVKILLKTVLKMSYNTYTGVHQLFKERSEQNVSLVMHQRFGATFQCPHSHIFCAFLSPCLANNYLRSFQSSFSSKI